MAHPLSRKQVDVLKALHSFSEQQGYIPSVRELAALLGKSATTAFQHLKALERKGYIRGDGTAHGWRIIQMIETPAPVLSDGPAVSATEGGRPELRLLRDSTGSGDSESGDQNSTGGGASVQDWAEANLVQVAVAGSIAAGAPIEAVEDTTEKYVLPREMVPDGSFALRVQGSSMIEDHILDGDLVIVQPQQVVRDGEIAVALLEDGSATLKRVFREDGQVRLQPANSTMEPIYSKNVRIQGRVVGVWRGHS